MRAFMLALALLIVPMSSEFAAANSVGIETVSFTYSGFDLSGTGVISSGTGIFAFPRGSKTISLSNLVDFFFFQKTTILGDQSVSSTFFYTRADLVDFSAVLTGIAFTSSLSLDTTATAGTSPTFGPESFHINSLAEFGAFTAAGSGRGALTQGTVQLVPEPTSILLVTTGLLGITGRIRKSRKQAKDVRA